MTDRRSFLAAAALAASAAPLRTALAQAKEADFLFVQNANYIDSPACFAASGR